MVLHASLRAGFVAVIAACLIAGCAAPGVRPALQSTTLARQVELTRTPFHPQEDYQCGPAALATVLGASGIEIAPDTLTDQVYVPARKGSLQIEMLAAARRNGAVAFVIPDRLDALFAELEAGHPVLVLLNLGLSWAPSWHYAVVIGYDLDSAEVLLRSGTMSRQVMPVDTFMHTWNRSARWAFVALPPGDLPADAEESTVEAATLAFARLTEPASAQRAFASAAQRWPDNLPLAIGLGNSAYQLGDLDTARKAFAAASQRHPGDGAAFNNLAWVLAKQGKIGAARNAVERALALGDRWQAEARNTLALIESLENGEAGAQRRKR